MLGVGCSSSACLRVGLPIGCCREAVLSECNESKEMLDVGCWMSLLGMSAGGSPHWMLPRSGPERVKRVEGTTDVGCWMFLLGMSAGASSAFPLASPPRFGFLRACEKPKSFAPWGRPLPSRRRLGIGINDHRRSQYLPAEYEPRHPRLGARDRPANPGHRQGTRRRRRHPHGHPAQRSYRDLPTKLDLKVGDVFEFTVRGSVSEESYSVRITMASLTTFPWATPSSSITATST